MENFSTPTKTCIVCSSVFSKPKRSCSNAQWHQRKYCGYKCAQNALKKDLSGKQFGRLLVVGAECQNAKGKVLYKCVCDCGNEKLLVGHSISAGLVKSCGCLKKERTSESSSTHKMSGTSTHNRWKTMKARCLNPNNHKYADYGGRGIKICSRYLNSFEAFFCDLGEAPNGLTLDRIDVDGHYSCGHCEECVRNGWTANCRWATLKQQANNQRRNVRYEYDGCKFTLAEWADITGIPSARLFARIHKLGWTVEQALTSEKKVNQHD